MMKRKVRLEKAKNDSEEWALRAVEALVTWSGRGLIRLGQVGNIVFGIWESKGSIDLGQVKHIS